VRTKKCKACGKKFTPQRPLQSACSPECGFAYGKVLGKRREKQEDAKKRQALKSLSELRAELQREVNLYVRLRDWDKPCISCGRQHEGQWHAGHYLTVGAHPELRFDPRNIHKQCAPCNNHLSGNLINYRKGLIERHGEQFVAWLEGPHEPLKMTREDLIAERELYRKANRVLKAARERGLRV
jgi:Bacteriophage Lambda NinG protein